MILDLGFEGIRTGTLVLFPVEERFKLYKADTVQHPFHNAILDSVTHVKTVDKKFVLLPGVVVEKGATPTVEQVVSSSVRHRIDFTFKSPDLVYTHIESYWDVSTDYVDAGQNAEKVAKAHDRRRMLLEKIANMYENLCDLQPGGAAAALSSAKQIEALGRPINTESIASQFGDSFEAFTTIFNADGVFKNGDAHKPYLIKLVRQVKGTNPNSLQIPISGGVQLFVSGAKLKLQVKPKEVYLVIDETPSTSRFTANPTGGMQATTAATPGLSQWPDDV